ncbi:MAG: hypothetical protein RXN89_01595 [Vulcanisaeta sp.]|uniref:hypothetical protein n=1 Tax=Vulcanisaeta sp. EB80 TaxID=1650660 RepID=UPI00074977A2|nr:hypothetical protein [Vulcanisaeta sp. EB80]KUO81490.1 MAG: hypothetical protein AT714_05430 [Vulcanisaeta sp. OSP_8]KUO81920.1 MAG: hypothetical protein AT718_02475 [Vulcanisaeta sp. JCHS_4]KUO89168.1 MAG: hypothetical protein AT716_01690 [Vulcanisaeta sp. MG_3]MCG2867208.1 hypothetical protein [Vulcanisaeta sp.]PVU72480.1 hypothetical protein DDW08_01795 [Vulcanisaeta sp. SCGC AB-777_J10]
MGISLVIYVSPDKKVVEKTLQTELKRIMLSELIDGEVIIGAAIIDSNGIPLIYHIPNTLTVKSLKNLLSLIEFVDHTSKINDDLLGPYQYLIIRFSNFKIAFFEMGSKGWLMVFVSPVWHVENVMSKIKQFMIKVQRMI